MCEIILWLIPAEVYSFLVVSIPESPLHLPLRPDFPPAARRFDPQTFRVLLKSILPPVMNAPWRQFLIMKKQTVGNGRNLRDNGYDIRTAEGCL